MNKEVEKQLKKLSRYIADRSNLLLLYPHYEFDHVLVDVYNPDLFTLTKDEIHLFVIQFKIGMN